VEISPKVVGEGESVSLVRFKDLTVRATKVTFVWDIMHCSLVEKYKRSEETICICNFKLPLEALGSPAKSFNFHHIKLHHISGHSNPQNFNKKFQ
jgi:hypothetical protein